MDEPDLEDHDLNYSGSNLGVPFRRELRIWALKDPRWVWDDVELLVHVDKWENEGQIYVLLPCDTPHVVDVRFRFIERPFDKVCPDPHCDLRDDVDATHHSSNKLRKNHSLPSIDVPLFTVLSVVQRELELLHFVITFVLL